MAFVHSRLLMLKCPTAYLPSLAFLKHFSLLLTYRPPFESVILTEQPVRRIFRLFPLIMSLLYYKKQFLMKHYNRFTHFEKVHSFSISAACTLCCDGSLRCGSPPCLRDLHAGCLPKRRWANSSVFASLPETAAITLWRTCTGLR